MNGYAAEFTAPVIDYVELLPMLVVFGVALAGVAVEAFVSRSLRHVVQSVLAGVGLLVAFGLTVWVGLGLTSHDRVTPDGAVQSEGAARGLLTAGDTLAIDGPTVFLWGLILLLGVVSVLVFAERRLEGGLSAFSGAASSTPGSETERAASAAGLDHTEVYPLMMFAVGGMMLFPASNDLLVMFIALEVLSLPLYLLTGLARRRRLLSQEAAMKYFLLGAFSSGFFLYGAALVYGYSGSLRFAEINTAILNDATNSPMLLVGIGLLAVGLLFKVGAVPFHQWTPDVYQGAPTPVTAFMSAGTKIAAFGALLRLFYVAFGADRWSWEPMIATIAVLTMAAGAVLAIAQTDVKRMLAYSSVAHTGFILVGVLGAQSAGVLGEGEITSLQAVLFYLVAYGFVVFGSFALVSVVRDANGEIGTLSRWAGLGKQSPVVAGAFAFFLLAMAGIPLTSGFIGKWSVFTAAASAGAWPVVVAAVLFSVVAAAFYVRVIVLMYFTDPSGPAPSVTRPSVLTATGIGVSLAVTLLLGVLPGPVLELAAHAGEFIR